jgi:hypothetical protein
MGPSPLSTRQSRKKRLSLLATLKKILGYKSKMKMTKGLL